MVVVLDIIALLEPLEEPFDEHMECERLFAPVPGPVVVVVVVVVCVYGL